MRFTHPLPAMPFTLLLLGANACTPSIPHSDPMQDWKGVAPFSSKEIPETIRQDARAYIQTLPAIERNVVHDDDAISYCEDGTGQPRGNFRDAS